LIGKKREDVIGLPCSNWGVSICNTDNCAIFCAKRGQNQTNFAHNGASYQANVSTLNDLQGKHTGFIEVIQDITESERMAVQQAKAEAASRAKGDFLANMSHEIRTPLNAIIGMVAIGKSSADMDRKNYSLSKIDDASKHLLGIINDILDMSKIEAGKFELSHEKFSFEKMIQRVADIVIFRVTAKHQKFSVSIDKAIPKILIGDDQRLAQVVTNLLGNAVKFTPEKGLITLDAKSLGKENGRCTIQVQVTDTGIGITGEQQERLFQSFSQARNDTARQFGGTGLGLSISKKIVEMMDGTIRVESEIDKGSSFIFTFKAGYSKTEANEKIKHHEEWKDIRVLIIDDEKFILDYLREILHRFGIVCDTALGAKDALDIVSRNGCYDIYFVDWIMPEMDGIELSKKLREMFPAPCNFNIILFSADEWSSIEGDAKKAGVDKFLSKPLFPSAISDIINECVGVDQKRMEDVQQDLNGLFKGRRILLA
jgi:signal transduction histidine kinase/ActR/RegA family two-component response regulator